jgi:hypothetical protein
VEPAKLLQGEERPSAPALVRSTTVRPGSHAGAHQFAVGRSPQASRRLTPRRPATSTMAGDTHSRRPPAGPSKETTAMAFTGQVLDNPISGERFIFHQTAADTGGKLLSFDLVLAPDGQVPGGHVHPGAAGALLGAGRDHEVPQGPQHRHCPDGR